MRIAMVCPYAWDRPGGVQTHVRGLSRSLSEAGHDVSILAPRSLSADVNDEDDNITFIGRAVPVPANGSVAPLAFGPLVAAGARRALRSLEPEVIHLHEPLIPSLSLLALWNAHAPAIGTFHASADASIGYQLGRVVLQRAMDRLAIKTAVSDAARALIGRYFAEEFVLTPNGIDAAPFERADPMDLGSGKTVLFFGRLEKRKGLDVLIQAMTRLRGTARLIVAGSGPEENSSRDLADRLQVDATFLGRVSEDAKASLYKGADVYCAPGTGGESFGIVLLEAMAAGTPVVCSDLPGFRAVAGASARLVPSDNPGALADALRDVLEDDGAAKTMSKVGTQIARSFDWSRLRAGVEHVYEQALAVS